MNPFDLYPARAYSNPDAFCPRPDLSALLARAAAGRLWTLIAGERRMGKSSAIIADCVRARRRILHVDLVGVTATEDINERFRWAWTVFQQQEASGIFGGLTAELAASIPVTRGDEAHRPTRGDPAELGRCDHGLRQARQKIRRPAFFG